MGLLPGIVLPRQWPLGTNHATPTIGVSARLVEAAATETAALLEQHQAELGGLPQEEAKRRLLGSDDGLTTIALASGFSHSQHFSTAFRRVTGLTPSAFRRQS